MNIIDEVKQVAGNALCLFDEASVERALDEVAKKITQDLAVENPLLLAVMNGGMIPLGKLLTRLNFPLQVDFCHATRYRNQTTGSVLEWKVEPHTDLTGRTIVVVDDILDEGFTLSEVVSYCRRQGAKEVRSFVLVEKLHDRKTPSDFFADYIGVRTEDFYLFGYGMDYKSYLRNAAGIYAVSATDLAEFNK